MNTMHPLKKIVEDQKRGIPRGIVSICSANEYVIEAAIKRAMVDDDYVLIEATANQVNQYGGYTCMTPEAFKMFVYSIAKECDFPINKIILGGDHLGPLTWQKESETLAMDKASKLIKQYVLAGFTKIHIDTSMPLNDEKTIDTKLIAERSAILCKAAKEAFRELKLSNSEALEPVFVLGSEVPTPGGINNKEESLQITNPGDLENTIKTFKEIYENNELNNEWENVIAFVVQPGVEFGPEFIHDYNREDAKDLTKTLNKYPNLIFEGHSTDYQTAESLKEMVEDGVGILKVGPALTLALREALFMLNYIENELFKGKKEIKLSNFINILESTMLENKGNWENHYTGDEYKLRILRKYSFSDRCRYYLPDKKVEDSINLLINNLNNINIPLTLISQFMPVQYKKIREGTLKNGPKELIIDKIINCLDDYYYAITPRCKQILYH